jgi:RIO kinase 1
MRLLYQECKLIHADLSEYNLLYYENKINVIDVSQSVEHDHPQALSFLQRDIKNINDFFKKKGVKVFS